MWRAITYVSSGLALVAFIVAAAAYIYKFIILKDERVIKQAPEGERAALIESTLEFFKVDTTDLTREQKREIALEQIHQRAARFRLTARVVVIISVLLFVVSMFALWRESSPQSQKPVPEPTQEPRRVDSKFDGKIEQVIVSSNPGGGSQVFVLLSIQNAGDKSIVQDFMINITQLFDPKKKPALDYKDAPRSFPRETLTLLDEKRSKLTINYQDSMEAKKFQAIESGLLMQGWLRFVVDGVKPEIIKRPQTQIKISFKDVSKHTYEVTYQMP